MQAEKLYILSMLTYCMWLCNNITLAMDAWFTPYEMNCGRKWSLAFNHTDNQISFMLKSLAHIQTMCTDVGERILLIYSLDCMTGALWDSCSVHRFHPGSQSIRCLTSQSCSYIPSFLQRRGSGLIFQRYGRDIKVFTSCKCFFLATILSSHGVAK